MTRDLIGQRLALRREMTGWPWPRLGDWLDARLGEIVDYAWNDIPFYRRTWAAAGVSPADFTDRRALLRFPRVGKEELAAAGGDWIRFARGGAGLCTKGTSGRPLVLWLDREDFENTLPGVIAGFEQSGMGAGMTVLLLSPAWHRVSALEEAAARYLGAVPVFTAGSMLDPDYPEVFLETLKRYRPAYVVAMTPLVLALIRRLDEQGIDARHVFAGVRALMILGLPVTPGLRRFIQARLGVPELWDRGGSTEGLATDECRYHDHHHIYEDTVYCEVLGADGAPVPDGTRGALVFTKLNRSPSPMVRYDSGDIASFAAVPCPCGMTFRRLRLYGRQDASLVIEGRRILPWDVREILDGEPELVGRNVLLVQDRRGWRGVSVGERPRLHVVVEGEAAAEARLLERLHVGLSVPEVRVSWSGRAVLQWSFRQVVDRSELPFLDSERN